MKCKPLEELSKSFAHWCPNVPFRILTMSAEESEKFWDDLANDPDNVTPSPLPNPPKETEENTTTPVPEPVEVEKLAPLRLETALQQGRRMPTSKADALPSDRFSTKSKVATFGPKKQQPPMPTVRRVPKADISPQVSARIDSTVADIFKRCVEKQKSHQQSTLPKPTPKVEPPPPVATNVDTMVADIAKRCAERQKLSVPVQKPPPAAKSPPVQKPPSMNQAPSGISKTVDSIFEKYKARCATIISTTVTSVDRAAKGLQKEAHFD